MHLLIVEDDPRLGRLLSRMLAEDRHVVELATGGAEGLELAAITDGLDAIILDIGLPDMSGLDVARRLRASGSKTAILMLTARDGVDDRVAGLDAGADDYLVKPFAYRELAARLRALRRRTAGSLETPSALSLGVIELDDARRVVTVSGERITLSPREFSLLECFLRHPDQVLSRDQLLDAAWPLGVAVTPNTVDAYVHLLREKLGDEAGSYIRTERGVGYRIVQA
jgi:DNA-binding response OmpR family regulator